MNNSNNATKSLWRLPSLWWSVVLISIISLVVALLIYKNSNISPNLSYKGWNGFLIIFRVPLGILAMIIPTVAVIASNHRSVQTKELISLQFEQNRVTHYYKHIEEFSDYLELLKKEYKTLTFENNIHAKLFPKVIDGVYSINVFIVKLVVMLSDEILELLEQYKIEDSDKNLKVIANIEDTIPKIFSAIGVSVPLPGTRININSKMYVLDGSTLRGYFNSISHRFNIIKSILRFDRTFQIPPIIRELSNIKINEIDALDLKLINDKNGVDISKAINFEK